MFADQLKQSSVHPTRVGINQIILRPARTWLGSDDIPPTIAGFDWLSATGQKPIFDDNARCVFKLDC